MNNRHRVDRLSISVDNAEKRVRPAHMLAWMLGVAVLSVLLGDLKLGSLLIAIGLYLVARRWLRSRRWSVRFAAFSALFVFVCWICPLAIWDGPAGRSGIRIVPIRWGAPTRDDIERAKRGDYAVGGAVVTYPFPPRWAILVRMP